MADYPKEPEARNVTEYMRDTLTGNLRQKELPTQSIRNAVQLLTMDTVVALAVGTQGWVPSGTAPLRITRLHLSSSTERVDFALADRNGTFDILPVGTQGGIDPKEKTLLAAPEAPLYIVEGTLNIYNISGSLASGTFDISYEGVRSSHSG